MDEIPRSRVEWRPCYRIVPSRFPPISLFEEVADPADLEAVYAIEALTNDRLREEVGQLSLVPPEDRVAGPGASVIMAAFTHLNPDGSRFSDGSFGVFYAANTIETAVAETSYHRALFMARTREPAQDLDMRVYAVDLDAMLHDIRGLKDEQPALYDPLSYAASQELGLRLRNEGSDGLVYGSVRDPKGECVALFRPRLVANARQERHLSYAWDGREIVTVFEKRSFG